MQTPQLIPDILDSHDAVGVPMLIVGIGPGAQSRSLLHGPPMPPGMQEFTSHPSAGVGVRVGTAVVVDPGTGVEVLR